MPSCSMSCSPRTRPPDSRSPAKSGGSSALIKCELQASGSLAIKVYTQTGALVKTVYDGPVASGKSTYEWDGTNSTGGKAASGIYFVKIKGPGLDKLDKIAVVR